MVDDLRVDATRLLGGYAWLQSELYFKSHAQEDKYRNELSIPIWLNITLRNTGVYANAR